MDATFKTVASLRVSTGSQDLATQKLAILDFTQKRRFMVDAFIESRISSRKSPIERRIEEMLGTLQSGDRLLVSELSRLGRSLSQVLQIVATLIERKIRFIAIKEAIEVEGKQDLRTKVMIAMFGLFAEVERDLISERTKEGLAAAKAKGKQLGRPKGALGKSKLDGKEQDIRMLLGKEVSKGPQLPRSWTSPVPPSTTSSRRARSGQADEKARLGQPRPYVVFQHQSGRYPWLRLSWPATIGRAPSDAWRCAPSRLALRPPAATPSLGEWIALNERPRLRPAHHPHRPS